MPNPLHTNLSISICEDADDAIAKGFNWSADPSVKPIEVKRAVVVLNGTVGGKPTVEFVLEAGDGQKFVFMITGALLKTIPC